MKTVLVVDDSKTILQMAKSILCEEYEVLLANGHVMAERFLAKKHVDLILMDLWMPDMTGMELLEKISADEKLKKIPVVFLTSEADRNVEAQCIEKGAMDFVLKPIVPAVLLKRIARILENEDYRMYLEQRVREKQLEAEQAVLQSIYTIVNTIEAKDSYTKGHSRRVASYAQSLATYIEAGDEKTEHIYNIALVHDVGKIGIPDDILKKQDSLSPDEYEIMKNHTTIGEKILSDITSIPGIATGALYHHENFDGSGYPYGKKGDEIPIVAGIIAIADTYDAMTSDRCYRKALPDEVVYDEIKKNSGVKFDANLTDSFLEMLEKGLISRIIG